MGYPISSRRPSLLLNNKKKKTCQLVGFVIPANNRSKNKTKKTNKQQKHKKQKGIQILGSYQRYEKVVEPESGDVTNCRWCTWNGLQRHRKNTEDQKNRDYSDHSSVKISKKTQKSPRHLKSQSDFSEKPLI